MPGVSVHASLVDTDDCVQSRISCSSLVVVDSSTSANALYPPSNCLSVCDFDVQLLRESGRSNMTWLSGLLAGMSTMCTHFLYLRTRCGSTSITVTSPSLTVLNSKLWASQCSGVSSTTDSNTFPETFVRTVVVGRCRELHFEPCDEES